MWVYTPYLVYETALVLPGVHLYGFSRYHSGISSFGSKSLGIFMPFKKKKKNREWYWFVKYCFGCGGCSSAKIFVI